MKTLKPAIEAAAKVKYLEGVKTGGRGNKKLVSKNRKEFSEEESVVHTDVELAKAEKVLRR